MKKLLPVLALVYISFVSFACMHPVDIPNSPAPYKGGSPQGGGGG